MRGIRFLNTVENFSLKLCQEVVLNKSYSTAELIKKNPSVTIGTLGMGVRGKTWHGIPDCRVRGDTGESEIIALDEEPKDDDDVATPSGRFRHNIRSGSLPDRMEPH